MEFMKGKAHKYGNDINTDDIIAAKYRSICQNMKEMATHTFEDLDKDYIQRVQPGDFIVAGKNFGCGSSREYAPKVIIETGISAIIASSFGRTFYRNCINSGLPLIECNTDFIDCNDLLDIDLESGFINNVTKEMRVEFRRIPSFMMAILAEGGVVGYLKKHKSFLIENKKDKKENKKNG